MDNTYRVFQCGSGRYQTMTAWSAFGPETLWQVWYGETLQWSPMGKSIEGFPHLEVRFCTRSEWFSVIYNGQMSLFLLLLGFNSLSIHKWTIWYVMITTIMKMLSLPWQISNCTPLIENWMNVTLVKKCAVQHIQWILLNLCGILFDIMLWGSE